MLRHCAQHDLRVPPPVTERTVAKSRNSGTQIYINVIEIQEKITAAYKKQNRSWVARVLDMSNAYEAIHPDL